MTIKQKTPSEIYDNWKNTESSITIILNNAKNNHIQNIPNWALYKTFDEISEIIENLLCENKYQYTLNLIASIEGLFNHQLKYYIKNKSKKNYAKALIKKFKKELQNNKYIKFDNILDEWKIKDNRIKPLISKLKDYLQYRHWLANGRHWSIHYHNIPDPLDIYLLYDKLNKLINFDLNI